MVKPVLLFGYGNPSCGDDALGPLLLEYIENHVDLVAIELLVDFQLQIEHALDLENRSLVLFVDASFSAASAFEFSELAPAKDGSYTSHAMSPSALMDVYREIKQQIPPPCFLLSIRGEKFGLGEGLSAAANNNLQQACRFAGSLLQNPDVKTWRESATHARTVAA